MSKGKVYLVGAGPGDPDLITRKGLRLIEQADVIAYDRLIPLELLEHARYDAELIDVGKAPKRHRRSQEEINQLLVTQALLGKLVVRLKGGDPFVFGRGSEEALACYSAGVPYEVVPGISSAFGVPAYAGVPLTHRHISTHFTVITGHEDPTDPTTHVDYQALARLGGTLVILMGVKQLPAIATALLDGGRDADTPALAIEWGMTARQRIIEGTLATLPNLAQQENLTAPATIVIGEVVALRQQGLDWLSYLEPLALVEEF